MEAACAGAHASPALAPEDRSLFRAHFLAFGQFEVAGIHSGAQHGGARQATA